ncbi:MAG TPA: phytanoyl-CoA dioxygenase family protein [Phenylobacterium sp.]
MDRFTPEHVATWRREGGVLIENFFTPEEVAAVAADFTQVFGPGEAADAPLVKARDRVGGFHQAQFKTLESVPLDCSPALNLIGVHPALIAFARAALETPDLHLYQNQAWAKATGAADYDQPFHCDYLNHTLVAPSEDPRRNTMTFFCYFSDVTEAHGPMHYVPKSDSERIAGPEATLGDPGRQAELHRRLAPFARSTAAPAGSLFAYGIDIYHRGTNLTAPQGRRFAVTSCFKRRDDPTIGYTAWPFHHTKPWARIFDHATPEQLACFGVAPPGDPFWTQTTLARAQARYPNWDLAPYRAAMPKAAMRA